MFSSWDLVRPRFWYPMSSLEQSMMELEHMSDLMSRSHFPFDVRRDMLAASSTMDDDDFFRDLPMLSQQRPTAQFEAQSPIPIDRDNDPNKKTKKTIGKKPVDSTNTSNTNVKISKQKQSQTTSKQAESDQGTNTTPHLTQTGTDANQDKQFRRGFSSYSFSNSSIVDDKGRRVTSTRRRYEDSTGRLKAVHEREVDGKKLRSTWNRMGPDDEGQHDAVCSSGTPDEFESLWQQTPFGEAQKKTIKDQQKQLEYGQLY
ncbi:hypothetical protein PHPALM_13020 [Phytophthora palmivora]|uniref:Uncharacterized protein n=1 Tax=Phytophthora palmivora TaxID=4796 RepID=A0A2P4XY99_9STRA|nr:hypothetical protein PHPALM_13020 [Phytophthora palmivora]